MRLNLSPPFAVTWLAACAVVATTLGAVSNAGAQGRHAPLPPPRPPEFARPQAAPPSPSAAPSAAPTQAPPAKAVEEPPLDPDHPPMLPSASRKRMSECGREWEALKKAGKDTDIGWRAFATGCLTR